MAMSLVWPANLIQAHQPIQINFEGTSGNFHWTLIFYRPGGGPGAVCSFSLDGWKKWRKLVRGQWIGVLDFHLSLTKRGFSSRDEKFYVFHEKGNDAKWTRSPLSDPPGRPYPLHYCLSAFGYPWTEVNRKDSPREGEGSENSEVSVLCISHSQSQTHIGRMRKVLRWESSIYMVGWRTTKNCLKLMSKENKANGGSCSQRYSKLLGAWIYGGVTGWPSVDAAYFCRTHTCGPPNPLIQCYKFFNVNNNTSCYQFFQCFSGMWAIIIHRRIYL